MTCARSGAIVFAGLCGVGLHTLGAWAADASSDVQLRIRRLEVGVRAEESVRAVKRLQHAYSQYLESGLWSDAADLFTADAVGEFHSGDDVATISGKDDLRRRFMAQAGRTDVGLAAGQLNEHLVLQPIVTLGEDGKTAQGAWHEVEMLGKYQGAASWAGGVYENDYRLDGGVWKISRLRFYQQYSGSFDDWGHKAPAKWNIPYHFEARHVGVVIPAAALAATDPTRGARLAQLTARLQRLNDETDVRNLQHSYGYYLDRKRWDDVADLFTDAATLELESTGQYRGRAHIRRALEVMFGAPPLRHGELFDHINLATVVTVAADGRSAAARTSQLAMLGLNGQYAFWEVGTYENRFVKEEGVWKFASVHYYPRVNTDYDAGWARSARPAPAPGKEFPPDRPSSGRYASFPDALLVAFDFANPVTGKPARHPTVTAGPAATLEELERNLDAQIGVDAVENLNSSYGYYIDESAWDNMAETYASTGSKELTAAGVYVGPDRIRTALNLRGPRGGRTPNFFTIHQLTQPVIHIAADGRSAKARLRLFQSGGSADGSSGSWIGGIYENTAIKENGEWKFGDQVLYHIYNASYRNGWARVGAEMRGKSLAGKPKSDRDVAGGGIAQGLGGALGGPKIAAEYPPDRPIVARQYAFPDIVEPPFHYPNPVTGRSTPTAN